jgi:hypothetical protein
MHPTEIAAKLPFFLHYSIGSQVRLDAGNQQPEQELNASHLPWGAMNWCIK